MRKVKAFYESAANAANKLSESPSDLTKDISATFKETGHAFPLILKSAKCDRDCSDTRDENRESTKPV